MREKTKLQPARVWKEAREIIWRYRRRVAAGLLVMIVGRLAGLVPPASSRFLIDDVVGPGTVRNSWCRWPSSLRPRR